MRLSLRRQARRSFHQRELPPGQARSWSKEGSTSSFSESSYSRWGMPAASRAALVFLQYGQPTVVITATSGSCAGGAAMACSSSNGSNSSSSSEAWG
jgi:hypothetical protein